MKLKTNHLTRMLSVCTGLACVLSITACQTSAPKADQAARAGSAQTEALSYFSQGMSLDATGNAAGAVSNYLESVNIDPDNASLHMLTSRRILAQEDAVGAIKLMKGFLDRHPDHANSWKWLATIHIAQEDKDAALLAYAEAIRSAPSDEEAYLQTARLLHEQKKSDEAMAVLDQALEHADYPLDAIRLKTALLLHNIKTVLDQDEAQKLQDDVIGLLQDALERYPEESAIAFQLASMLAGNQRVEEMLEAYRSVEFLKPDDQNQRMQIAGHLLRAIGDAETARLKLQAYVDAHPDDAWSHYLLGQVFEFGNQSGNALNAYLEASRLDAADHSAKWKTIVLLSKNGQPAAAERSLQTALNDSPDNIEFATLAGNFFLDQGNYQAASAQYGNVERLLQDGKSLNNQSHYNFNYARALHIAGDRSAAIDHLETAMYDNMSYLEVFWRQELKRATDALPDEESQSAIKEEALELLRAIKLRFTDHPLPSYLIGRHLLYEEDFNAASRSFASAATIAGQLPKPESFLTAEFYFDQAASYERQGKLEKAESILLRAIALKPDFANAYNFLAYTWAENNMKLEKALDYVGIALNLDPNNGAFIDTRGWILFQQGKYEQAYSDLSKASQTLNNDPVITEHLGDVLLKLERPVEALGFYRIATELGAEDLAEKISTTEAAVADALNNENADTETETE